MIDWAVTCIVFVHDSFFFWAVLEHVEGTCLFEGSGPVGGIGEELALRYFKDVVQGLMYLHSHVSVGTSRNGKIFFW